MNRSRLIVLAGLVGLLSLTSCCEAQFYGGGYGGYGYGGYGYRGFGHSVGSFAPPHSIGGYYPVPYSTIFPGYVGGQLPNIYGYNDGFAAGYYGIGAQGYGAGYGIGVNPIYGTTTTIIRGGPTGGVVQYSNNGNGYTYVADSTYPTVIQQQPTLGLSRTIVPASPPPVIRTVGTIKLICPKTQSSGLTYSLNGHVYSILPGYSQTFNNDRTWVLEFLRGGSGSESVRYTLKSGAYTFAIGSQGWELHQPATAPTGDLPAAPLPDPDVPTSPTAIPSLPPSPLPPP